MNKNYTLADVVFPEVGITHIAEDLAEIVEPKLSGRTFLEINTSAQPNSKPHLGTVTTIMSAFAVSQHLQDRLCVPVRLTFDALENAPGEQVTVDKITYQKSLKDCKVNGVSLAETYMTSFHQLFKYLHERTTIQFLVRSYDEYQRLSSFRKPLLEMTRRSTEFGPILAPHEKRIRIRFPCPECKYVDKGSVSTEVIELNENMAMLKADCFSHGEHRIVLREDNSDFVDTNTPLREVAKGYNMAIEARKDKSLPIMIDGSDWSGVWLSRVAYEGITRLGISYDETAIRFFTPTITDWSGAKFSKSLYVKTNAYRFLPKSLLDFSAFIQEYEQRGLDMLWKEVQTWATEPKRFFRNYSVDYFEMLLEDAK